MKKLIVLFTALFYTTISLAQNTLHAIIKEAKTNKVLMGATATLNSAGKGAVSDTSGLIVLKNIPNGTQIIKFSYMGYETLTDTLSFPLTQPTRLIILLTPNGNELESIVISATRSSRTIASTPTRVEVISGD